METHLTAHSFIAKSNGANNGMIESLEGSGMLVYMVATLLYILLVVENRQTQMLPEPVYQQLPFMRK
jgi:hypothetical protein